MSFHPVSNIIQVYLSFFCTLCKILLVIIRRPASVTQKYSYKTYCTFQSHAVIFIHALIINFSWKNAQNFSQKNHLIFVLLEPRSLHVFKKKQKREGQLLYFDKFISALIIEEYQYRNKLHTYYTKLFSTTNELGMC